MTIMEKSVFDEREHLMAQQVGPEMLEAIDEQIDENPEVMESIAKLRAAEAHGKYDEVTNLRAHNLDLIDRLRVQLLRASGAIVNLDNLEDESEARRKGFLERINESLTGEESSEELLQKFQLLDKGNHLTAQSIESPLFRKRTSMAFKSYISTVKSHMDMVDYMRAMGESSTNADAKAANDIRVRAHDAVSREIATDLGISFEAARSLVAKMRDGVIPEASEKHTYTQAGKRLAEKYANHTAWMVEDKTKTIFRKD
jgi:hypothetical protein